MGVVGDAGDEGDGDREGIGLFFFLAVTGRKPSPADSAGVIVSISITVSSVRSTGSSAVFGGAKTWAILCI